MFPPDVAGGEGEERRDGPVECEACASAFRSATARTVAFLVLDGLTLPLVGCDDHRETFASICGVTADGEAELLNHRPAGGITCPSCQFAPHSPEQPVIPVDGGAVAVLACPKHQSAIVDLFRDGLKAHHGIAFPGEQQ